MTTRKGLGKGKGSGYYNLPPTYAHDKRTHHLAGKGIKSVQKMPQLMKGASVKSKFTGAHGQVISKEPFAVKYEIDGKKFVRFSNPKYWVKGGKGMVMVKFDKNSYTMIPHKHLKDFQAQYGGSVQKGGKLTEEQQQFLSDSWENVKAGAAAVGSGIKRAYEYEKENLPAQIEAIKNAPKNISKAVAKKSQDAADYVSEIEEAGASTKENLARIFGKQKSEENSEDKVIRPEIKKMDRQVKRVSEIKRQIAQDEDGEVDSSLISELEEEESQLRDLQEKATELVTEDMTNAELRLLAIRHKEGDGFFSALFGSENEYEKELLRRIRKEKKIDNEIYAAKHSKKGTGQNIIKEIFF